MKYIYILVAILLPTSPVFAQNSFRPEAEPSVPAVGQPMPDFILNHVTHYKQTTTSLRDFKGKWLILDIWNTNCSVCIRSFSKVNSLQHQFKEKIQWVMIGDNNTRFENGIEKFYERLRENQNLQLVVAYDSILAKTFRVESMPHIIIIDPLGTVRFITAGLDMDAAKLQMMIEGKKVSFLPKDITSFEFDGSDTVNVLSRSVLSAWNGENYLSNSIDYFSGRINVDENAPRDFMLVKAPLIELYNQAYFGKYLWGYGDSLYANVHTRPILELKDSSLFQFNTKSLERNGFFNYMVRLPSSHADRGKVMEALQGDLKKTFGYSVTIEQREMPVIKLVSTGSALNLVTKGEKPFSTPGSIASGLIMKNISVDQFLRRMTIYIAVQRPPFVDGTGITGNIDITMDTDLTRMDSIRAELRKNNLDLVKGVKKMRVLVIRDAFN